MHFFRSRIRRSLNIIYIFINNMNLTMEHAFHSVYVSDCHSLCEHLLLGMSIILSLNTAPLFYINIWYNMTRWRTRLGDLRMGRIAVNLFYCVFLGDLCIRFCCTLGKRRVLDETSVRLEYFTSSKPRVSNVYVHITSPHKCV